MSYKDINKKRESDLKYRKRITSERNEKRLCRTCGIPLLEEEIIYCHACRCKRRLPMKQIRGIIGYAATD